MRNTPEFWAAVSAMASAFAATVLTFSVTGESRNRRSGLISLAIQNEQTGNSPQKFLVVSNLGQSTARDTQLWIDKSDLNWKIQLVGSDQEFESQYRIFLGDLSVNSSGKRRILISMGVNDEVHYAGKAIWTDYRRKNAKPFSLRSTIY